MQQRSTGATLTNPQEDSVALLAALASQRPTLRSLLVQNNQPELAQYLETLRGDTELDLLLVCDDARQAVAQAGAQVAGGDISGFGEADEGSSFYMASTTTAPQVWLLAAHAVDVGAGNETQHLGRVVAGVSLDDEFVRQMRDRTGLEHILYTAGLPVASSLPTGAAGQEVTPDLPTAAEGAGVVRTERFSVGDRAYYATRLSLHEVAAVHGFQLESQIALDVGELAAAQRDLAWLLTGSVLAIALFGSVMAVLLAHRIGRPLAQLSGAAAAFSEGELNRPVTVRRGVSEVSQVADALEQARIDLRRTITELQEAQEWNQNLLAAITEGIVILDEDSRVSFFSPGAERITGWSREEALGRSCDEVFQLAESGERFSEQLPAVGKRSKLVVRMADGQQATLAISGARMAPSAAGESGVALVLRNVSETEIMHRLVGDFLANVTHEFRTPLTSLAASAELLLDQAPTLSRAELQELLSALHLSILSLQTLIDNLLESARVEAGRFRVFPQPVDLRSLIAEAVRVMEPLASKHFQRLILELPAHSLLVHADPRRTGQVLINLLSNAIKYSPDETEISVQVTTADQWARVAVADCGPGAPEDYHPDLFRPFVRPASMDNLLLHRAGLGLSVAKAIIDAHGGQVRVEDRPGGGSIFWFTLPLAKKDESAGG